MQIRRFVKDFANNTLNHPIEKKNPFEWTCECQEAFVELKKRLCSSSVLADSESTKEFITDCNNSATSAVLSQEHESANGAGAKNYSDPQSQSKLGSTALRDWI